MPEQVTIAMIAAVARNNIIGANGAMPWTLPSDLRHFRAMTIGKPVIMGRKQFETVGRPLPDRVNIVVTRQSGYSPGGVLVINDFDAAIDHAETIARADGAGEVMIIGGGEIYALGMSVARRLYISHIDAEPEGDTVFPGIGSEWQLLDRLPVKPDRRDTAKYTISVYGVR